MSSLEKTLSKIQKNVADGSFYEAQQMFKTVYARYRNKKALTDSYTLAEEGARLQLTKGQLNCGIELALLLVESYIEDKAEPSTENLDRLLSVYTAFPEPPTQGGTWEALQGGSPSGNSKESSSSSDGNGSGAGTQPGFPVKECVKFLMLGVKWLGRCSGSSDQIQHLHGKAAEYIWQCMGIPGFGWATTHFVRADNTASFAAAIIQCMEQGSPAEEDLFISRACLQMLAVTTPDKKSRQLQGCDELLAELEMFRGGRPFPETPLMHFTTMLLKARPDQLAL